MPYNLSHHARSCKSDESPAGVLRSGSLLLLLAAFRANAANFRAAHCDIDAAVARDLLFQLFVQFAFHFAHFSAAQTCDMNMVAGPVAFVEMAIAAKVEQIELVNQAVALQEIDRTVDGDSCDVGVDFLRALEDFTGIEMAARRLHHLEKHAALAREPDPARAQFALQTSGRFVDVDAFSG